VEPSGLKSKAPSRAENNLHFRQRSWRDLAS
jgi:hypothetical protein